MSRQVALDGGDQRTAVSCPFNSAEEVWEFDAVEEYGLPEFYDLVRFYEDYVEQTRRERPGQLVTGGCYSTPVSGAIAACNAAATGVL